MKRVRKKLKKYFIPHEENDFKPHLLRPRTVAFVLAIAIAAESFFLFGASYLAPASRLFGVILTNVLVDGTNQSRAASDLPPLHVDPLLAAAAQQKANDMVANNYFAHTSPAGLTPWYWFEKVGYNFTYAGENLAVNFSDSQDVTNAWMNSPEHRANILNGNFSDIGMATAQGEFQGHPAVYVVELFGKPVPPAPPAEPIAFVNTATAAGTRSTTVVTTAKPAPKPKVTTIVATSELSSASSNETFVAVKGAEMEIATSGVAGTTEPASETTEAIAPATVNNIVPQSNLIQNLAVNPRAIVRYAYLFVIILFAIALGITVFMKVHLRHPQLIFAGMLVILVTGLFILLNQHVLAGAAIL